MSFAGSAKAMNLISKVVPSLKKLLNKLKDAPKKNTNTTNTNKTNRSCNCFTAGTKVLTDEGEKNIEDIEVGDKVLSKDESGISDQLGYKEVVQLISKISDSIYTLQIGNQAVEATGNHPFWVEGKGWVLVEELIIGDLLVQSDGNKLEVKAIKVEPRQEVVFNFEVADFIRTL